MLFTLASLARSIGRALVAIATSVRHTAEWMASPTGRVAGQLIINALVTYTDLILRFSEAIAPLFNLPKEPRPWPNS